MTAIDPVLDAEEAPTRQSTSSVGRFMAFLSGGRLLQQVGSFAVGMVLRGLLGPTKVGVWNLVEVWRQQLAAASLGMQAAADREMPMLRGQGRWRDEAEMRWSTFTFSILESIVIAIAFWIYWLLERDSMSAGEELGLGLVPLLALIGSVVSAYELFLKNRKYFDVWAALSLGLFFIEWSALLWVLVGGLEALLIGMLVGWTLRLAIYAYVVKRMNLFSIRFRLQRRLIRPMLAFGLPLSIWGFVYTLGQRVDSLVIGTALGTKALALYFIGPQIAASLSTIPTTLATISYPNLMESYGRDGARTLEPHVRRYQQAMLVIAPLLAGLGVFGAQFLVEQFLPSFADGLPATKTVIAALVFSSSSLLSLQILYATKRIRQLVLLTALALGTQISILAGGALAGGLTLEAAAWSSLIGQAVFAIGSLVASARLAGVDRAAAVAFWGRLPLGWAAFIALLFAVDAAMPELDGSLGPFATAAAKFAVFAGVAVALTAIVDREALRASRSLMRHRD